jgi:hypothetical protein
MRPGVPNPESTQVLLDPAIQAGKYRRCLRLTRLTGPLCSGEVGWARVCSLQHASPVLAPPCSAGQCVAAGAAVCLLVRYTAAGSLAPSRLSRDVAVPAREYSYGTDS